MNTEFTIEDGIGFPETVEETRAKYGGEDIPTRTKRFALRIVKVATALPNTPPSRHFADQLMRAGTSVGAHLHEARRSRSDSEMISKIAVALQELDETDYWIWLIIANDHIPASKLKPLQDEIQELIAILVAASKTLKSRQKTK
jgi:four helix bundle protein